MSDADVVVERGYRYELDDHGDVVVTGFRRQIESVDRSGIDEETILVRINPSPDEPYITNRGLVEMPLSEFYQAVDTGIDQEGIDE